MRKIKLFHSDNDEISTKNAFKFQSSKRLDNADYSVLHLHLFLI